MRILSKVFAAGLMLALAACVSSRPAMQEVMVSQEMAPPIVARATADGLVPLEGPMPSQPRGSEPASPPTVEQERLGTRWGEEIRSPIRFVSLTRFWPGRPEAQVTVRYDGRRSAATGPVTTVRSLPVSDGAVDFSVLGARGTPMRLTPTGGGGDLRLQGRSGDVYRLAFDNRGRRTVEVVATVDGLDVISGRSGSIANRGYVVRPGERLVIEGFRKSEDEVAAFRFSGPDESYAANTPQGDPRNIGVIGLALFTLDDPANEVVAASPRPFPADDPRDPRFAPPPTP